MRDLEKDIKEIIDELTLFSLNYIKEVEKYVLSDDWNR